MVVDTLISYAVAAASEESRKILPLHESGPRRFAYMGAVPEVQGDDILNF